MKILVWGAGPVGLFLGTLLKKSGAEVYFWGRPRVLTPIEKGFTFIFRGVKEESGTLQCLYHLEDVLPLEPFDFVLVAFKSFHNPAVIPTLKTLLSQKFVIVQNGINNEKFFFAQGKSVISAALTTSVHWLNPCLLQVGKGGLALSPPREALPLGRLWRKSRLSVKFFPAYEPMKWSKLLLNSLGNPISALLRTPPEKYLSLPEGLALEKRLLKELLSLMRRVRIPLVNLPGFPVRLLPLLLLLPAGAWKWLVGKGRGEKPPSLLLDICAGRPLEVEALLGKPLELAHSLALNTPLLSLIYTNLNQGGSLITSLPHLYAELQRFNRPP